MGEFTIPISRRDLLKLADVTAVGAVLSGQTSVEATDNLSGDEISRCYQNDGGLSELLLGSIIPIGFQKITSLLLLLPKR